MMPMTIVPVKNKKRFSNVLKHLEKKVLIGCAIRSNGFIFNYLNGADTDNGAPDTKQMFQNISAIIKTRSGCNIKLS